MKIIDRTALLTIFNVGIFSHFSVITDQYFIPIYKTKYNVDFFVVGQSLPTDDVILCNCISLCNLSMCLKENINWHT